MQGLFYSIPVRSALLKLSFEICARFYEMIIIVNKIRIKCHIRSRLCSAKSMIIAEVFLERSFNLTKKSCFKNPNPNGLIIG